MTARYFRLMSIPGIARAAIFAAFAVFIFAAPGTAYALCSNPSGAEGHVIYNDDYNVVQFCDGTNWVSMAGGSTEPGGSDTQVQFNDGGTLGGAAQMFWDKGNNRLGVGVASPTEAVDVNGNVATLSVILKKESGAAAPTNQSQLFTAGTGSEVQFRNSSTGELAADTNFVWDNTNKRLGIGTTSPAQTLEIGSGNLILGRVNGTAYTRYIGIGGGDGSITPGISGGAQIAFNSAASNDNSINFLTHHGGVSHAVRMTIDRDGNVGIGTTSPSQKLTVAGGIAWYANDYGGYSYPVCHSSNSNPSTLGWCSSSRRYKKNIEPLKLGLETVMKLQPVTFDWKNRDEHDLGLIAEDVAAVEPLLAEYDDDQKPRSVKYAHLTALLTKAIQELKADNDDVRAVVDRQGEEIKALKAANDRYNELRQELDAIKAKVH
ncbi:MAG: hypothetical protein GC182_20740 [Rhodopseudomonas sp.]|nr:hypothetical protein [Rhodopseudomonas sp.]